MFPGFENWFQTPQGGQGMGANPGLGPMLALMGSGILGAAGPLPMNQPRGPMVANAIQQGIMGGQQAQTMALKRQLMAQQQEVNKLALAKGERDAMRDKRFDTLLGFGEQQPAPAAAIQQALALPGQAGPTVERANALAGINPVAGVQPNAMQNMLTGVPASMVPLLATMDRDTAVKTLATLQAKNIPDLPSGFQRTAQGLAPIPGGPNDLGYVASKAEATTPFFFQKTYNPETGAEETIAIPRSAVAAAQAGPGGAKVVASKPEKITDEQHKAGLYATRMGSSHTTINELESLGSEMVGTVTGSKAFPNVMKSSDRQRLEQAERNFVNATLRRESGAVINPDEFENAARQYFPRPGDKPEVIAQKRRNREEAISGIGAAAGPALPKDQNMELRKAGALPELPGVDLPPLEKITPQSLAKMTPAQRKALDARLKKMGF